MIISDSFWSHSEELRVYFTCTWDYIKYIHQVGVNIRRAGAKLQVGDPKKKKKKKSEVRKFHDACESFQTKLLSNLHPSWAPTWNWRFVSQCCDVPNTVQADQEKGRSERRPSLVRRLSILPKPCQRRTH